VAGTRTIGPRHPAATEAQPAVLADHAVVDLLQKVLQRGERPTVLWQHLKHVHADGRPAAPADGARRHDGWRPVRGEVSGSALRRTERCDARAHDQLGRDHGALSVVHTGLDRPQQGSQAEPADLRKVLCALRDR